MKKLLLILMTVMVTTLAAKAQVKPTVLGEYIASQLDGKGRVMEIMGLEGSSPAIERHNGFADALKTASAYQRFASPHSYLQVGEPTLFLCCTKNFVNSRYPFP
jgi:hypothetical protein